MAILITTKEVVKEVYPEDGTLKFTLKELQKHVGGYIELVKTRIHINNNNMIIVNEEGLLMNLPLNELASVLTGRPLVGDVLWLNKEEWDHTMLDI